MESGQTTVRGVVRALDGADALVEVEQGGCGRCHEEGGCGGQQLTQMFCSSPKTYRVENVIDAAVGDRLVIGITSASVRKTASLAYGTPLVSTIAGAALGSSFGGDGGAILGAAIALPLSFIYIHFYAKGAAGNSIERPHIVSRS